MKKLGANQIEFLVGGLSVEAFCNTTSKSREEYHDCVNKSYARYAEEHSTAKTDMGVGIGCSILGVVELGLLAGGITAPFGVGVGLIMGAGGCVAYGLGAGIEAVVGMPKPFLR